MKSCGISSCVIACVMIVALLLAGVPHAAAQEDECFQKGGWWDDTQQKCFLTTSFEIKIDYPLDLRQYPFVEQVIDNYIQSRRSEFLAPLFQGAFVGIAPNPLTLQIDYQEFPFNSNILSLLFTIYDYGGGAHGMTTFQSYIFDLGQQRVLSLYDLLPQPPGGPDPLTAIAPMVQQIVTQQLGDAADPAWIAEGTAPTFQNYQTYILTPDALVFYFPPYQVAAYAAGPQIVSLPLSQLGGLIAPEYSSPSATQTAASADCMITAQQDIPVYMEPNFGADQFSTLPAGSAIIADARTADGWYGFDPGVAQAGNEGLARLRWVFAGVGSVGVTTSGAPCDQMEAVTYP